MPKGVGHTADTKAEALRLYAESGTRAATEATGVPPNTIRKWASKAGVRAGTDWMTPEQRERQIDGTVAHQQRRRDQVRERLLAEIHDLFDRMGGSYTDYVGVQAKRVVFDSPPPKAVRDLAVSLAVLLDKLRLEEGKSTTHAANRVEVANGGSPVDAAIADLLGQFDQRTRVSGDGSEGVGGVEPVGETGPAAPR